MNKKTQDKKADTKLKHDGIFKSIMTDKKAAAEFLQEYLPQEIKDLVNLDTVKPEKDSYVEENLKQKFSDIVYSIKTKDNDDAFIYTLLEHQSSVDQTMALRLWKYILLLAERHVKDKGKLPLIYPLIIYAGKAKYTAPRNLWNLFDNPTLAKQILTEDFKLIDLNAMSDEEIIKKDHIAMLEYILKHIKQRDVLKLWEDVFKYLPHAVLLDQKHDYIYIKQLLYYTDAKITDQKQGQLTEIILNNLPNQDGDKIMRTIADNYIEEGMEKGIHIGEARGEAKGVEKTAIKMLQQRLDLKLISTVTGFSVDQILKLKNKL